MRGDTARRLGSPWGAPVALFVLRRVPSSTWQRGETRGPSTQSRVAWGERARCCNEGKPNRITDHTFTSSPPSSHLTLRYSFVPQPSSSAGPSTQLSLRHPTAHPSASAFSRLHHIPTWLYLHGTTPSLPRLPHHTTTTHPITIGRRGEEVPLAMLAALLAQRRDRCGSSWLIERKRLASWEGEARGMQVRSVDVEQ